MYSNSASLSIYYHEKHNSGNILSKCFKSKSKKLCIIGKEIILNEFGFCINQYKSAKKIPMTLTK